MRCFPTGSTVTRTNYVQNPIRRISRSVTSCIFGSVGVVVWLLVVGWQPQQLPVLLQFVHSKNRSIPVVTHPTTRHLTDDRSNVIVSKKAIGYTTPAAFAVVSFDSRRRPQPPQFRHIGATIITTTTSSSSSSSSSSRVSPITSRRHHPFQPPPKLSTGTLEKKLTLLYDSTSPNNNNSRKQKDEDKFGWAQRWASIQCLVLGAIVGSIAQAPISLLHNLVSNNINPLAQWEYDTDGSAVVGGLFAIVYRYCVREDSTENPQLPQGCISAMILIRTLPQIQIPSYCTPVPLNCHHDNSNNLLHVLPIPYFYIFDDPNVLQQLFWYGLESTVLFTVTARMMEMAMEQTWIRRFPG